MRHFHLPSFSKLSRRRCKTPSDSIWFQLATALQPPDGCPRHLQDPTTVSKSPTLPARLPLLWFPCQALLLLAQSPPMMRARYLPTLMYHDTLTAHMTRLTSEVGNKHMLCPLTLQYHPPPARQS